jgi:hypothetical protein
MADRAQRMLDDPLFKQVFADIRESLVSKLESCGVGDIDAQHELTVSLQLLMRLKTQLSRYSEQILLDEAKQKHESWLLKAKRTFTP